MPTPLVEANASRRSGCFASAGATARASHACLPSRDGTVLPGSSPMFAAARVSLITGAKVRECESAKVRNRVRAAKITPTDARGIHAMPAWALTGGCTGGQDQPPLVRDRVEESGGSDMSTG